MSLLTYAIARINDKLLHALIGFGLVLFLSAALPLWIAFMVSVVAGAVKEIYDYHHPLRHNAEGMDFLATAGGGLLAALLCLGVK